MNNLKRFLDAQSTSYHQAEKEIINGRKAGHWMWFIFPQLATLGRSQMAQYYAIRDLKEAREYLKHSLLGSRLLTLMNILVNSEKRDAHEIFGSPDDLKFHSCITLFRRAAMEEPEFIVNDAYRILDAALTKYFGGKEDVKTVELLNA